MDSERERGRERTLSVFIELFRLSAYKTKRSKCNGTRTINQNQLLTRPNVHIKYYVLLRSLRNNKHREYFASRKGRWQSGRTCLNSNHVSRKTAFFLEGAIFYVTVSTGCNKQVPSYHEKYERNEMKS